MAQEGCLKKSMKIKKSFTLIELMIVVVIIGVLASFSVPIYTKAIERGRQAEGISLLKILREAQLRYYATHGSLAIISGDLAKVNSGLGLDLQPFKYFNDSTINIRNTNPIVMLSRKSSGFQSSYRLWIYYNGYICYDTTGFEPGPGGLP